MTTYNIHPQESLDYNFPSKYEISNSHLLIPRDILLQKYLKLDDIPKPRAPIVVSKPLGHDDKSFNLVDPLQDLLNEQASFLSSYKLQFPTKTVKKQVKIRSSKASKKEIPTTKNERGVKRSRVPSAEEPARSNEISRQQSSSVHNTPIPNKTIYFSPSGPSKQTSTPVSVLKEVQLNNQRSNKKILKFDKALVLNKADIVPQPQIENQQCEADDSDYDHLACHADNILRMAVDSTMLGSTLNGSFSSMSSNTFANDSVLEVAHKQKYPDFLTDENDADSSVLEGLKAKWLSNSLSRAKVEINADDINAAVNG
ncbi:hypothetical protein DFJ63DRAFT_313385 [Scheffersomyces coipomensis]|uniref:uncharacterized protein n=1 Tax=Scheffersomyces coipomensis TaxID=1788519 RepID=UPI00315CDA36